METRANYVLIGVFTLVGALGAFFFLLWLAKVEVNRQYAYYDVLFDNVAGLGTAGSVRYNGLPVGQVVELELDETDPSKVRVRVEIDADTPVKTDTVAQLQSQGVTGVSYVALSGGSPGGPSTAAGGRPGTRRQPVSGSGDPGSRSQRELMDLARSEPGVKRLLHEFGAQVLDIRPLEKSRAPAGNRDATAGSSRSGSRSSSRSRWRTGRSWTSPGCGARSASGSRRCWRPAGSCWSGRAPTRPRSS